METTDWLLDADPAIRWQVLRDLTDAGPDEVAAERARVAVEGWGAQLLDLQDDDGRWDGGTYRPGWVDEAKPFFDAWTATHFSLTLYDALRTLDHLRATGAERDARCDEAIDLVARRGDRPGRWPLENTHQGPTLIEMEGPDGFPSRWNTLRARRVLEWAGVDPVPAAPPAT